MQAKPKLLQHITPLWSYLSREPLNDEDLVVVLLHTIPDVLVPRPYGLGLCPRHV
jgi:hypothetical protein